MFCLDHFSLHCIIKMLNFKVTIVAEQNVLNESKHGRGRSGIEEIFFQVTTYSWRMQLNKTNKMQKYWLTSCIATSCIATSCIATSCIVNIIYQRIRRKIFVLYDRLKNVISLLQVCVSVKSDVSLRQCQKWRQSTAVSRVTSVCGSVKSDVSLLQCQEWRESAAVSRVASVCGNIKSDVSLQCQEWRQCVNWLQQVSRVYI